MARRNIGNDTIKVFETATSRVALETLFWGDQVDWLREEGGRHVIRFRTRDKLGKEQTIEAFLGREATFSDARPMIVRFVDVGQGDGAILETPRGRRMIIDGGEGEHMRNYMRAAFGKNPIPVEVICATHGDADHFSGLTRLLETNTVAPRLVLHNGLVKRPGSEDGKRRKETEMFGATQKHRSELYCTELASDIRSVDEAEMNKPFLAWKRALDGARGPGGRSKTGMETRAMGDTIDAFEDEEIRIDVLGPVTEEIDGKPALRFLHANPGGRSYSASHTINGHSLVLRVTHGNVRFLFAADLNEESEELLLSACRSRGIDLTAEVLKVPHHGSADFSMATLQAIAPVVSIVSSGDESTRTEYIHPRAGLIGALGRASRVSVGIPLVYVTETVAFMERLGKDDIKAAEAAGIPTPQRLYRKLQFGIVHVRTDGRRLLIVVPSGKEDFVEAYAYTVDARGLVTRSEVNAG